MRTLGDSSKSRTRKHTRKTYFDIWEYVVPGRFGVDHPVKARGLVLKPEYGGPREEVLRRKLQDKGYFNIRIVDEEQ